MGQQQKIGRKASSLRKWCIFVITIRLHGRTVLDAGYADRCGVVSDGWARSYSVQKWLHHYDYFANEGEQATVLLHCRIAIVLFAGERIFKN